MKADIIKRIKLLEKRVSQVDVPSLIMINYDWDSKDWVVREDYFNSDEKGKFTIGFSKPSKTVHVQHYKEYIIQPQFMGTIILNLLDCPDEFAADLQAIKMKDFRKENHLENCGISFEALLNDEDGSLEQSFDVVVYQYTE